MICSQKGFTTVEILLVVLIIAVIGGAGAIVYSNSQKDEVETTRTSTSKQEAPEGEETKPVQDDETAIREALSCKANSEITCEIEQKTATLAWATKGDGYGGANYYLSKETGEWKVIHSGNGDVPADVVAKYNIPKSWLGPQLDEIQ